MPGKEQGGNSSYQISLKENAGNRVEWETQELGNQKREQNGVNMTMYEI